MQAGCHQPPLCRHCRLKRADRARGLCNRCYDLPGVKELYPITSKYARRGVGNFAGGTALPAAPTTAAPGTPEKLAVMEERAKAGRAIFHPADSRGEGDERPALWLAEHTKGESDER